MASSGSSDGNFQSRVDKIFGSLAFSRSPSSSASASASPAPSWSLTDGDVEKREWRRDKSASYDRDETPCAASFDELLKQQRSSRNVRKQFEDDLGDLGEDEDQNDDRVCGEDDELGDEWSIRSSIGLDRTLDNEEEEDEYDKVALGRENAGERLFMKDITDQGSSSYSEAALRESSNKMTRDPRANHVAAKLRLKEDEAEAKKYSPAHHRSAERREPHSGSSKEGTAAPKPILKRKENNSETRSSKRVRFDLDSGHDVEDTTDTTPADVSPSPASVDNNSTSKGISRLGKGGNQIPDYLKNPSRYTHYSFDSPSDVNEKSTAEEHSDLPKILEGSKASESESLKSLSADGPKKVTFIPQKKTKSASKDNKGSVTNEISEEKTAEETTNQAAPTIGIAEDGRLDAMEEDEDADADAEMGETERCNSVRRGERQYRAKRSSDETDT